MATGHFLGSGRTSFRFSAHCALSRPVPAYFFALRSPGMRRRCTRARAHTPYHHHTPHRRGDRIIPTCSLSCHARTHIWMPGPPAVVRSISYTTYERGIFASEHTRQLVSFNIATRRRLNAKVQLLLLSRVEIFVSARSGR